MYAENLVSFLSEMQNQPVNPAECSFDVDELHYWDSKYKSVEELLAALGDDVQIIGAIDPSLARNSGKGDPSAIVILAVTNKKPQTFYVIEADIRYRSLNEMIEDVLAYHARYRFTSFAVEVNQFQRSLIDLLEEKGAERGLYISLEEITNTVDKYKRILALHPWFKRGTLQFCRKLRTLLEEIRYFPKSRHDDGLDALEMSFRIAENYSRNTFEDYRKESEKVKQEEINKPDSQRKVTGLIYGEGDVLRLEDVDWLMEDYER